MDNPSEIIVDGEIAYRYIYNPYYYITKSGTLYSTYIKGAQGKSDISKIRKVAYGEDKDGYYRVVLSLNGEHTRIKIHQIMINQFMGGYKDNLVVNHIDGNKHNNSLLNLELITSLENTRHAWEIGLNRKEFNPNRIKVDILDNVTGDIYHFGSLYEASCSGIPLSITYIRHIKNNDILFGMCHFVKVSTGSGKYDYKVECYYNGMLYKTYDSVGEASSDFNKPKNSVSSAFRSNYSKKVNRYTVTFPNLSTIESIAA